MYTLNMKRWVFANHWFCDFVLQTRQGSLSIGKGAGMSIFMLAEIAGK